MKRIVTILTGIGFLIGIYLFLNRSKETVSIIDSIATNATAGIRTLQGRG